MLREKWNEISHVDLIQKNHFDCFCTSFLVLYLGCEFVKVNTSYWNVYCGNKDRPEQLGKHGNVSFLTFSMRF